MDEKLLLEAIGQMIDERMDNKLQEHTKKLDEKMDAIKSDIARLNHEIVPKINIMYEGIDGINEKFRKQDRMEDKLEDHGNRISALEHVYKEFKKAE